MRAPVRLWTLLASGLAAASAAARLDCPLPGGTGSGTAATCALYPACQWAEQGGCLLRDDLRPYAFHSPPMVIHTGYQARLQRLRDAPTMFGGDVTSLDVFAVDYDDNRLGVSFRDANSARYEVPLDLNLPPLPTTANNRVYEPSLAGDGAPPQFHLSVTHGDNTAIQMLPQFIYSDQFIQATFLLGVQDVYGFGENNHDTFRHDLAAGTTWPLFALDRPPGDGIENLYGVHPFFLGVEDSTGKSFGMLFLNSNAMEYRFFLLDGKPALTYRTTGGILDMYFFFGDSPLEVLGLYHKTIGLPMMPPYWGLGFQLSRYGYTSTDEIRTVTQRMQAAMIPQDVQYADIDYMDVRRDFTVDQKNFGDLAQLIGDLRNQDSIHFVLIYDPAIAVDFGTYPTVDRGVSADAFIKWMNSSLVPSDQCHGCQDYMVGYVWPVSKTVFPDFFKNSTIDWWVSEMKEFLGKVGNPDGFWIDMNEPSSFGTNTKQPFNWPDNLPPWSLKCPDNKWDTPPYPTRWVRDPGNESKRLSDHTLCMSGLHTNDITPSAGRSTFLHYDVHNMYGWSESRATRIAIDRLLDGKRGVLFGRSTYPGAGRWVGHWTGDNDSRWKDLRRSIIGLLEFSMFGIPYVGADICGFRSDTTENLCLRWMQLGAFYPFSRNHNSLGSIPQDPASWDTVAAASREALNLRYSLLPYLYTLFWRAASFGETVIRPLAFQFPSDAALRGHDTQFLWGGGVMVAPVLDEATLTSVNVTFPAGEWYDLRNGSLAYNASQSANILYEVPISAMIPVFGRGGVILPMQEPALNTEAARKNAFKVAVLGGEAAGELFWDDGETSDTYAKGAFYHCNFKFQHNVFSMEVTSPKTESMSDPRLDSLTLFGVSQVPDNVLVDGQPLSKDQFELMGNRLLIHTSSVDFDMARNHTVELQM